MIYIGSWISAYDSCVAEGGDIREFPSEASGFDDDIIGQRFGGEDGDEAWDRGAMAYYSEVPTPSGVDPPTPSGIVDNPPDIPILISPYNGQVFSTAAPRDLAVSVNDIDGDSLTVNFYDASDDSLIGSDDTVVGSGIATTTWSNIARVGDYNWYVTVSGANATVSGGNYTFTLASHGRPEHPIDDLWWTVPSGVGWWGDDKDRHRKGGLRSTYTDTDNYQGRRKGFRDFYTTYSGLSY